MAAEPDTPPADEPRPDPTEKVPVGTGVSISLVLGLLLGVAVVILAFQNVDDVTVDFLTLRLDAPLVVVILGSVLIGVAFDEVVGVLWRRRRRKRIREKEELERLRGK